jgi:hypothetical protein
MTTATETAPQVPPAGTVVQTVDLGPQRWIYYRSYMIGKATALANLLNGVSEEDESRFDDGTLDADFEEANAELLGQLERECTDLLNMIVRFRHNLHIRPKDPVPPE